MILTDTFKYFARFPSREGVLEMFANGSSARFPAYAGLREEIARLPPPLIPEIEGFVFGQSFDHVKRRIDALTGTYLFVDFGEFRSGRDRRNSITDTQQMAATVAMKLHDSADLVEVTLATDYTLSLAARLRRRLIADSRSGVAAWRKEMDDSHECVPFVSPEFKSVGWTLVFTSTAADMLGGKEADGE